MTKYFTDTLPTFPLKGDRKDATAEIAEKVRK